MSDSTLTLRYSLERSRAQRLVVENPNDRDSNAIFDADGLLQWEDVAPDYPVHLAELEEFSGTYTEVSEKAKMLNNRQEAMGPVAWVFAPHPIQMLAA